MKWKKLNDMKCKKLNDFDPYIDNLSLLLDLGI